MTRTLARTSTPVVGVRRPADRLPARAVEGIITAVVAITGVEDHVRDNIVPGAFRRTLGERRPKVVFHHQWTEFVGRVLHIEEVKPGDRRLPKRTKDGKAWPAGAGALIATMQFNMATESGRNAYEWARFFTESNECEWSIGYKVVPGKATKGRDGVRYIYDLDVYEVSLVLFGAASLSMTLDVKSIAEHIGVDFKTLRPAPATRGESEYLFLTGTQLSPAASAVMEAKAISAAVDPDEQVKVAGLVVRAADTGRVLMLQRDITDEDDPARGKWEWPGGHLEDDEAPVEGAIREWTEETGHKLPKGEHVAQWDAPNGIYRGYVYEVPTEASVDLNMDHEDRHVINPDDPRGRYCEVTAWFDPKDLPDMPSLRDECRDTDWSLLEAKDIGGPHDTSPVGTPGGRQNWVDEQGGLPAYVREIAHALMRDGHDESEAIQMAVGAVKRWAAGGDGVNADTQAKAAAALAAWEAKKAGSHANDMETKSTWARTAWELVMEAKALPKAATPSEMETKAMPQMSGSYQEREAALRDGLNDLFHKDDVDDSGRIASCVCIEFTFDDRVYVTDYDEDGKPSYVVPYTFADGKVSLGEPEPCDLSVVAVPAEGDEKGETASDDEAAEVRFMDPAMKRLADAVGFISLAPEGKSLDSLRPSVLRLLDSLAEKGMDMTDLYDEDTKGDTAPSFDEEDPWADLPADDGDGMDDETDPADQADDAAATTDAAEAPSDQPDDQPLPDEKDKMEGKSLDSDNVVTLSADDVHAELAALRA